MSKKKILSEAQVEKLYVVTNCFNVSGEDGEKRFDAGTEDKPNFVTEKDFEPDDWKILVRDKTVVPFEKPESEEEKEQIAFEVIDVNS